MFNVVTLVLVKSKDVNPEPSIRNVVSVGRVGILVKAVQLEISKVVSVGLISAFIYVNPVQPDTSNDLQAGDK
jgi:hypothetical protein